MAPTPTLDLGTDSPLPGTPVVGTAELVAARVTPRGSLENLSHEEVAKLLDRGQGGLYPLLRRCALAVLNSGSYSDEPTELFDKFKDFDLRIVQDARGVKLEVDNAPAIAFVDGEMIQGVKEHLFAVLRDIVYIANEVVESNRFDLTDPEGITNAVFCILRNARVLKNLSGPDMVVCWGGHSISREEYDYSKLVGYELGLRGLNVCTGCGPGAMKGPMKGATIAHAKQRIYNGRYIGLTEPSIVAAEPPNPIVNHLVILPDIEKRLEAFVRLGHGIIIFPGGVGTTEEILYLLGLLLDPGNADQPMPVVLTGPKAAANYFKQVDAFIGLTLGPAAQARYRIIVDDPAEVARVIAGGLKAVKAHRQSTGDAYNFNWTLAIPRGFQLPFQVTHESVAALHANFDQPVHDRAVDLRRMFSAIVAGNIKEGGVRQIAEKGPFKIHADPKIMQSLDALLKQFVADRRMKLSGEYKPVYRLVS
ncbi:MAG: nucleotide 5'-monophosphate nucleosidase PpnN [Rhodospirillaceae bacterium]|nr:nucleotide 5'-monophosphate nucleosidase PpnN [Rhodospirillaceae bacterium]